MPKVDKVWDDEDLELGNDPFLQMILLNCVRRFVNKMSTYDNTVALKSGHLYQKSGKVHSGYDYCKRHGKPLYGKKGGNKDYI